MLTAKFKTRLSTWVDPEGIVGLDPSSLENHMLLICFLRNTCMDPSSSNWVPRVQLLLEGRPFGPL